MDATLAILGGAILALYYFGKKKIDDLQKQVDQNSIEDKQREDDLAKIETRINNPLPDGDIWIYPYVLFSNLVGEHWGGVVIWEIHNKTSNTPYTVTGIMSNLRLGGYLCTLMPANSEMFPYKIQGGSRFDARCVANNFKWLDTKDKREAVKKMLSPKNSTGHKIVECDVVLEILNTATGKSSYKTFRNCKGDAIWTGGVDYVGSGSNAKDDPNWSHFAEKL